MPLCIGKRINIALHQYPKTNIAVTTKSFVDMGIEVIYVLII